ncbi:uncharacterized protein LOC131007979 [Salvia miltiorrhiza]|uniref:uncharacterized protein LOC131007979 n=1 Tax=Salvia miltiorrhiza TaxID=226208 RepID=UPI0025AD67A7|nr:uncharacterized protein LOC131007979 [Salvia miltiorrhiza]
MRMPSAACKSPFRRDDVRGTNFLRYLRSKEAEQRNVGLPYLVDKNWFGLIKKTTEKLDSQSIDSYLAVLAAKPELAGFEGIEFPANIAITGTMFSATIDQVWNELHGKDPKGTTYDPKSEEIIQEEQMKRLCLFAVGKEPRWGEYVKKWNDVEKLIMIVHFNDHWATCLVNFTDHELTIYDSNQHKFDDIHLDIRQCAFLPICRIIPQILKKIGYYEKRNVDGKYTEWIYSYPYDGSNNLKQLDSVSCGVLSIKYVEMMLTGKFVEKNMSKAGLKTFREKIAESIYKFSTDASTFEPLEDEDEQEDAGEGVAAANLRE